jgi:predicted DNA-binding transcriptional regulator AlpA
MGAVVPSGVKLLRLVDIAELLGVTKQRADQLRQHSDFPLPIGTWSRGDLWAAADVRRWARSYKGGAARWGKRMIEGR